EAASAAASGWLPGRLSKLAATGALRITSTCSQPLSPPATATRARAARARRSGGRGIGRALSQAGPPSQRGGGEAGTAGGGRVATTPRLGRDDLVLVAVAPGVPRGRLARF